MTLAALSRAENTVCKSLADLEVLTFLTKERKFSSRFLFRAVLILSFLTFLIAERMIGMDGILAQVSSLDQALLLKLSASQISSVDLH